MWPANKKTAPFDHTAPFYGTFIRRDAASHFMFFGPISRNKWEPNIRPDSTASPHLVVMPRSIVRDFNRPRTMQPQSRPRFPCQVACPPLSLCLTHLSTVFAISVAGTELRAEEIAIELALSTLVNFAIQSSVSSLMERCLVWSLVPTVGVD
jgi:hypothetical protein